MSYAHQMTQQILSAITVATGQGAALSAAADIGVFAPGLQPVEVRGVAVVVTTTATVTAPVVDFYRRPTVGSDTNRVLIKRLNPAIGSWVAGNTIYADVDGTVIKPGEDLIAEVSTAATAGNGHAIAMIAPHWDTPANNSKMVKVA